jgi:hypothetical protein
MAHPTLDGAASTARSSSATSPLVVELALLAAAGLAAALLHEAFRWPLKLPGHHGLEWLAILMAARLLSQRPGAALAVAGGAALGALGLMGTEPNAQRAGIYLVQGLVLDGLFLLLRGGVAPFLLAPLLGATVHALSPLVKNALLLPGAATLGSLSQGLAWPLATHAAFGAVGALCGALAVRALRRTRPPAR